LQAVRKAIAHQGGHPLLHLHAFLMIKHSSTVKSKSFSKDVVEVVKRTLWPL